MKSLILENDENKNYTKLVLDYNHQKEGYVVTGKKEDVEYITKDGFSGVEHYIKEKEISDFFSIRRTNQEIIEFVENKYNDEESLQIMKSMHIIDIETRMKSEFVESYYGGGDFMDFPSELLIYIDFDIAELYVTDTKDYSIDDFSFDNCPEDNGAIA